MNKLDKAILSFSIFILLLVMSVFYQGCAEPKRKSESASLGSCFNPDEYDLLACTNVCPNLWVYIIEQRVNYFETESECVAHFNTGGL